MTRLWCPRGRGPKSGRRGRWRILNVGSRCHRLRHRPRGTLRCTPRIENYLHHRVRPAHRGFRLVRRGGIESIRWCRFPSFRLEKLHLSRADLPARQFGKPAVRAFGHHRRVCAEMSWWHRITCRPTTSHRFFLAGVHRWERQPGQAHRCSARVFVPRSALRGSGRAVSHLPRGTTP